MLSSIEKSFNSYQPSHDTTTFNCCPINVSFLESLFFNYYYYFKFLFCLFEEKILLAQEIWALSRSMNEPRKTYKLPNSSRYRIQKCASKVLSKTTPPQLFSNPVIKPTCPPLFSHIILDASFSLFFGSNYGRRNNLNQVVVPGYNPRPPLSSLKCSAYFPVGIRLTFKRRRVSLQENFSGSNPSPWKASFNKQ